MGTLLAINAAFLAFPAVSRANVPWPQLALETRAQDKKPDLKLRESPMVDFPVPEGVDVIVTTAPQVTFEIEQKVVGGRPMDVIAPGISMAELQDGCFTVSEKAKGRVSIAHAVYNTDTFSVALNTREKTVDLVISSAKGSNTFNFNILARVMKRMERERSHVRLGNWKRFIMVLQPLPPEIGITRAYILPADSKGRAITSLGKGEYVGIAAFSFASGHTEAYLAVFREPDSTCTLPAAGK